LFVDETLRLVLVEELAAARPDVGQVEERLQPDEPERVRQRCLLARLL